MGTSRPNGENTYHTTVHAEIQAVKHYKAHPNNRKLQILIWRVNKEGGILPAFSCLCCKKYLQRKGVAHKVLTFENEKPLCAIVPNPSVSKGMKLKFSVNTDKQI